MSAERGIRELLREIEAYEKQRDELKWRLEKIIAWKVAVEVCAPELGGLHMAIVEARTYLDENY